MAGALVLLGLSGCSTEYALRSLGPVPSSVPGTVTGTIAVEPTEPIVPRERVVELGVDVRADVADYLFVIDSSASMMGVLNHVLSGFDALEENDAFPHGARIAVMSTLPADPLRPDVVHPRAKQRWWLQFQPGFQSLVDADQIAVFREVAPPHVAERFAMDGCAGWFAASDVNAKGVPCLVANSQLALYPVLVEAGLLALAQRLQRPEPLFRSGAAANVIFVSDTHDPGLSAEERGFSELLMARPTFERLRVLAMSRQSLASFRVHAVAPAAVCAEEDWTAGGPAYFTAARAGGGQILDVCTANPADYVAFIERMATEGARPQSPVIALNEDEELVDVLVDDAPATFAISDDGRAVTLREPLPTVAAQVRLVLR